MWRGVVQNIKSERNVSGWSEVAGENARGLITLTVLGLEFVGLFLLLLSPVWTVIDSEKNRIAWWVLFMSCFCSCHLRQL